MTPLRIFALLAALALAGIMPARAQTASPTVLRDFMIQNVCLDAAGGVVEGISPIDRDPRCARQRDLRPGERLPYHKDDHPSPFDRAGAPQGYQRHDSFPVATRAFGIVAEQSFDFGAGEGRRFGAFDAGKGDGGDIVVFSGITASIAATEDGGAGFQLFAGRDCRGPVTAAGLVDSWLVAELGPAGLSGERVARLNDLKVGQQQQCPARLNAAFTRWHVEKMRYRAMPGQGTPVTLQTLVSEHYGGPSPARANHVERFYFTRELGGTRWERWQDPARSRGLGPDRVRRAGAELAQSGRCSPAPSPAGGDFVMVDCREWTLIAPPFDPAGDPPGFFIEAIRKRRLAGDLFAASRGN